MWVKKENTPKMLCDPARPRGELRPVGRLRTGSDRRDGTTRPIEWNSDIGVQQEEAESCLPEWLSKSQWAAGGCEQESSCNDQSPRGECALGVGLALANQSPRCSRILRITSEFSFASYRAGEYPP